MRISDWSSDVCSSDLIKCDGVHGAFVVVFVDLQTIANVQRPAQLIYEHAIANQVIVPQLAFVRVAVFRSNQVDHNQPPYVPRGYRPDERRVGKEGVSTTRYR